MEKSSKFQTFENLFKNSITAKESSLKLRFQYSYFDPSENTIFKGFEKQTMARMGEDFEDI